jgi:hypothetical protein
MKKMLISALIIGGAASVVVGVLLRVTQAAPVAPIVMTPYVSDAIRRLAPLTKYPSASMYGDGVEIVFTGAGVTVKITTPNGNIYNASGQDLTTALQKLSAPSQQIAAVLEGWGK